MYKWLLASALSLALLGFATTDGYRQFYTALPGVTPEGIAKARAAPPPADPQVARTAGPMNETLLRPYERQGYLPIGYSSFTSGYQQNDDDAVDQGRKHAADLVLIVGSEYSGSVTSTVPITTPTTSTSYTTGTATAFGTGGSATAFGNSTTTTYGSNTNYVPITVDRFQYGAVYLVKQRFHLGVRDRDLNDDERQQLQTNHGVYILFVVDGSPAYASDMLPGDVVTAVDGTRVDGAASMNDLLAGKAGQVVELTILRQGKTISKSVSMPP
jgi:membrane-associated protease RseP (regulator of RpoE activity)